MPHLGQVQVAALCTLGKPPVSLVMKVTQRLYSCLIASCDPQSALHHHPPQKKKRRKDISGGLKNINKLLVIVGKKLTQKNKLHSSTPQKKLSPAFPHTQM